MTGDCACTNLDSSDVTKGLWPYGNPPSARDDKPNLMFFSGTKEAGAGKANA